MVAFVRIAAVLTIAFAACVARGSTQSLWHVNTPVPKPAYAQRVLDAALRERGMRTRGLKHAPRGRECVAAVQKILDVAGLNEVAKGTLAVARFRQALLHLGFREVLRNQTVGGDFVVLSDAEGSSHVGICLSRGCRSMISNSSSKGRFSWQATPEDENAAIAAAEGRAEGRIAYLAAPY